MKLAQVCESWPVWDGACELEDHAWLSWLKKTGLIFLSEGRNFQISPVCIWRCLFKPFLECWTSTFSAWTELQKRRLGWKCRQNAIFKLLLIDKLVGCLEHFLQQPSMLKLSNSFEPRPNSNLVSFLITCKSIRSCLLDDDGAHTFLL